MTQRQALPEALRKIGLPFPDYFHRAGQFRLYADTGCRGKIRRAQIRPHGLQRKNELGDAFHRMEIAELADHLLPLAEGKGEAQQRADGDAGNQDQHDPARHRLEKRFHHSLATAVAST